MYGIPLKPRPFHCPDLYTSRLLVRLRPSIIPGRKVSVGKSKLCQWRTTLLSASRMMRLPESSRWATGALSAVVDVRLVDQMTSPVALTRTRFPDSVSLRSTVLCGVSGNGAARLATHRTVGGDIVYHMPR
ncbi:peptidyl-prolyl cis-trans isomerase [Striga asiatica]|uniref:Peptidyl-prolyl cis-trans isomerase n=1 Tax=Striga asiatica TaxID=4170 RepID=A0A5A7R9V7_STRAF|nr:peptidyl-prolyl cis-trans isomerase [Striga asiatica]